MIWFAIVDIVEDSCFFSVAVIAVNIVVVMDFFVVACLIVSFVHCFAVILLWLVFVV